MLVPNPGLSAWTPREGHAAACLQVGKLKTVVLAARSYSVVWKLTHLQGKQGCIKPGGLDSLPAHASVLGCCFSGTAPPSPQCHGDCFNAIDTGQQLVPGAGERSGSWQRPSAWDTARRSAEQTLTAPSPFACPQSPGRDPSPAGRSPWLHTGTLPVGPAMQAATLLPSEGDLNWYWWVSRSVFTEKRQVPRTGLYLLFVSQTSVDLRAAGPASGKHQMSLLPADTLLLVSPRAGQSLQPL